MKIVRWTPKRDWLDLRRDLDEVFEPFFREDG